MKKCISFAVLLFSTATAFAQSEKYLIAMEKAVAELDTARSPETFQKAANTFERIAAGEKTEWLPAYYQAYAHMMLATAKMQAQDMAACTAHLDKAQTALNAALAIAPKESEIMALQGYIYQGRIWENPMVKGAEYTPRVQQALQTAMAMNPQNPRPYYLTGQQLLHTPEFYGGGAKAALPLLEKAAAAYEAWQMPNALHPRWGKQANEYMLGRARQ
ncbi:MAG: hypothetical protein KF852_03765 [Saprospiraceae bacterium]|nr:hypothetical protein [Saprospiraceae bacterium]